jgi:diguanylate cyclase (GGDEF)-like protein
MFKTFEQFSKCLLDAYAVFDAEGKVVKCNPMFSQLLGKKTKQILKEGSVENMLKLSVAGKPLDLTELLHSSGPTRLDEVSAETESSNDLNLIVGVYPFVDEGKGVGAFMLFRDVTAEANLQDKYKDKATQSITDPLTGLFNRTYFEEYMANQVVHLEHLPKDATQRIISVVMLDIDHFKKVNDDYGHQAGDYVIKEVASHLKETFRRTDIVCRYGGEEFLAILPGTDLDGACIAAEKFRQVIASFNFEHENVKIPITISSGVAQIRVGEEKGERTIARADEALYHSKESGRNMVSLHDGSDLKNHTKK